MADDLTRSRLRSARPWPRGGAVVALESTLVAHGLPWPENLETAPGGRGGRPAAGAVPGDDRGRRRPDPGRPVGRGAGAPGPRRDVPQGGPSRPGRWPSRGVSTPRRPSRRRSGSRAGSGIGVMATGGLGGVHRDAATTFDVSNDLDELARADGAARRLLGGQVDPRRAGHPRRPGDPRRRRRRLPDRRRCRPSPARSSGLALEARVESPDEAAALVRAHRDLGLPGAIVLAQPVARGRRPGSRRDGRRPGPRPGRGPPPAGSPARRSPPSCSTGSARPPEAAAFAPTGPSSSPTPAWPGTWRWPWQRVRILTTNNTNDTNKTQIIQ